MRVLAGSNSAASAALGAGIERRRGATHVVQDLRLGAPKTTMRERIALIPRALVDVLPNGGSIPDDLIASSPATTPQTPPSRATAKARVTELLAGLLATGAAGTVRYAVLRALSAVAPASILRRSNRTVRVKLDAAEELTLSADGRPLRLVRQRHARTVRDKLPITTTVEVSFGPPRIVARVGAVH